MAEREARKKVYIELIRVLAFVLVMYNHLPGYTMYMYTKGVKQFVYMYISMITRINVPLFFMISGSLLLARKEEMGTVIRKRVPRQILVMLLFELALYLCYGLHANLRGETYALTAGHFLRGALAGNLDGMGSYWYMYAYLAFLLLLPFMQRAADGIKKEEIAVLFVLRLALFALLPVLNLLLHLNGAEPFRTAGKFELPLVTISAFFFPLIGYYLDRCVDIEKISGKKLAGLAGAATAGILLSCLCTLMEGKADGQLTQNFVRMTDAVSAAAAFIIIKYIMVVRKPFLSEGRSGSLICFVGSLTFGIYLLNPFLKLFFYQSYKAAAKVYLRGPILSVIWVLISMCAGGAITFLLKKIPGIRKLI